MTPTYPPEIVATLSDLMRMEHFAFNTQTRRRVHSILTGQHASRLRGRGLDFAEVRQYVAGDDIRTIDWHVTARTGKAHTKVFNEEKERPVFVVVDQSPAMFFGSQVYTKSVIGAQAAALIAFHTLRAGDRLGGIVFDHESYDHITPRNSKAAVEHFLQCIVARSQKLPSRKTTTSNRLLLNQYLQRAAGVITTNHVVVVISDFSDLDQEGMQDLTHLSYHNDVILVQVTDPLDAKWPDGKLVLGDGEHQIIWQNNRREAGKKQAAYFNDLSLKFPRDMLRYNIPVIQLDTLTPGHDQLIKRLAQALTR